MRGGWVRRRAGATVAAALALVVVTGCVADPPPPTVVGEERSEGEEADSPSSGALLALDTLEEGFNPHLVSDQGVDTDLVSSLLLPSAFEQGPDGAPELNTDVLVSAEPLPTDPDTIRYTIRPRAQWSDGVPVAAEDFEYLWRQMTTQPGVVDPAGYERIVAVRPGAGGKVVDVEFEALPDQWRSLFNDLLPGHILKDAPNGFQGAMAGLPVMSAGPYMVRTADIGLGEIEFVRNDRYWSSSPELDQIVVRRATGAGQLGTVLRGGPGSLALVRASPVATDVTTTVPEVDTEEIGGALQLELGFNTAAPTATDAAVRRAVAAAVTPEVVGRIVTGGAQQSMSSFPFPPGTTATDTADREAVDRELTDAGFVRVGERWEYDGVPLSVTLGVEAEDELAATTAYTVSDQLRASGIGAQVWELGQAALYADALPHGLVDGVVSWQRVDGDPVVAAASRFTCAPDEVPGGAGAAPPTRPRTTVPSLLPPTPDTGTTTIPTTPGTSTGPTATSTPPRTIGAGAPARTSGVYGVCDEDLDRMLDGALDGNPATAVDLDAVGDRVAELALRVPLARPSYLLAADTVDTGADDGPRLVPDVFETAPTWRRNG